MQDNSNKRDNTLDALRGGTMLYIVVIIHGLTSYGYLQVNSPIISILLFEMPLMFFISGASITVAPFKPMQLFIVSRIKRVVIPYCVWGLLSFLILLLRDEGSSCIKDILLADNNLPLPFCNQLWFIKPYLAVSILGYFLFTVIYTINSSKVSGVCIFGWGGKPLIYSVLIICLILLAFSGNFSAYVTCYLFFYTMAFLYKRWTHLDFIICILSIIPLYILIKSGIYSFVMQENKFPPNILFALYGTIVVAIVIELSKTKIFNSIEKYSVVKNWNKYGYEIYLYQNYVFWITWILMERLSHVCVLPDWFTMQYQW